ncbi:phage portal protein [Nocardioides sp. cx-169]|uniref:phage portal protein n=1 Tax=Nocardioides sp. cx-169 TaxID=2899080 RepID=UPI001E2ED62D|nr:phage portal protein [Nocardioides sp. cx-169]MCD4535651.1 phage portal protein [Nocardioides sp. cx-169]
MALSLDDARLVNDLSNQLTTRSHIDERFRRYYQGTQRLEQIGLAVPPELRRFETVVNWPRLALDSLNERLDVKSFILPGEDVADAGLAEAWAANDLDSEAPKLHIDTLIYGRGFVCAGTNDEDSERPLLTVESPRELMVEMDHRTRRVNRAFRVYGQDETDLQPKYATIYQPDLTRWLVRDQGRWVEYDRDEHNLGRVPVVPFFNRLLTGDWLGESEMTDIIPLTDAAARSLTNLQLAGETHAVPQKYVLGATKGDFVDPTTNEVIPAWESYMSAFLAMGNEKATVGQLQGTSLSNFHDTVNHYARLVAAITGLPPHFLGFSSENPASADAIRSSESRLVKRAELKQRQYGDSWGRVMSLYLRLRDGDWPDGRQIRTEWYDASTPTVAARTDAVVKLMSTDIISREGAWDELGWSEARKARERGYFERQALDPVTRAIVDGLGDEAPPLGA